MNDWPDESHLGINMPAPRLCKSAATVFACLLALVAIARFESASAGLLDLRFVDIVLASQSVPADVLERLSRREGKEHTSPDELLFVFATIGDSHITAWPVDSQKYIEALSIASDLLSCYVADINSHLPSVEFTVHLGDITHGGIVREFSEARSILDSLESHLYPVVGNHDNMQSDNKQAWRDFAGMESTSYTFDWLGFHFIAIDCTGDPYPGKGVECDSTLRRWVAEDLAANRDNPTFVLSHYNMWERTWSATFDTTRVYGEYCGVPELRQVLEDAGNVLAVINGHVHANRVEKHNGIYYVDTGATLVGPPSIRYFHVYPESVVVTSEYISDSRLFDHAVSLCSRCSECFDPLRVCDFIDGSSSDKEFIIRVKR